MVTFPLGFLKTPAQDSCWPVTLAKQGSTRDISEVRSLSSPWNELLQFKILPSQGSETVLRTLPGLEPHTFCSSFLQIPPFQPLSLPGDLPLLTASPSALGALSWLIGCSCSTSMRFSAVWTPAPCSPPLWRRAVHPPRFLGSRGRLIRLAH